jgi:hypothetical protein
MPRLRPKDGQAQQVRSHRPASGVSASPPGRENFLNRVERMRAAPASVQRSGRNASRPRHAEM